MWQCKSFNKVDPFVLPTPQVAGIKRAGNTTPTITTHTPKSQHLNGSVTPRSHVHPATNGSTPSRSMAENG